MRTDRRGIVHARLPGPGLLAAMLVVPLLCAAAAQSGMRFTMAQIDSGAAESVAVADVNNDGTLDIVSAESWFEAPRWTKRPIRTIPVTQRLRRFLQRPAARRRWRQVHRRHPDRLLRAPHCLDEESGVGRWRLDRAFDRRDRAYRIRLPRRSRQRRESRRPAAAVHRRSRSSADLVRASRTARG